MTKITKVDSLDELLKYWPRLLTLAIKETDHKFNPEHLLQLYLKCFATGVVFAVRNDQGLCGLVAAEEDSQNTANLILRAIPNDFGTGLARACMEALKHWASTEAFDSIEVSSTRLSGSRFHYFEKTLGFRRNTMIFKLQL